ncbi:MAG: hypothetical protein KGH54_02775 [Candidatus Micrarchaeota archaeon]|nr:hypothetical protein [Candidatus Micrarchaeota archaeon]
MAKKGRKEKGGRELLYVEADTIEDIARWSSRFDSSAKELIISNEKGRHRIIALVESIQDISLALYKDVEVEADTLRYVYGNEQMPSAELVNNFEQRTGSSYSNLIDIDLSKFKVAKPASIKDVRSVRIGKIDDLIKSVIKRAVIRDNIEYVYAFEYKGKSVLGVFDLIEELSDEKKTFYYSISNKKMKSGFARYRFATNTVDFSNEFGEHSYMYVKIINLASPFPFFKE